MIQAPVSFYFQHHNHHFTAFSKYLKMLKRTLYSDVGGGGVINTKLLCRSYDHMFNNHFCLLIFYSQGLGLFCLEEHRYSPDGYIFSQGPGMYKIPTVGNIPREFNVRLLKERQNEKAVYSAKVSSNTELQL